MCNEFTAEERKGAVKVLRDTMSALLNAPENKLITLVLVDHLRNVHKYSPEDAVKILSEMESEALRAVADSLEERTVEFLSAVKTT